jgi:hypothetical protein
MTGIVSQAANAMRSSSSVCRTPRSTARRAASPPSARSATRRVCAAIQARPALYPLRRSSSAFLSVRHHAELCCLSRPLHSHPLRSHRLHLRLHDLAAPSLLRLPGGRPQSLRAVRARCLRAVRAAHLLTPRPGCQLTGRLVSRRFASPRLLRINQLVELRIFVRAFHPVSLTQ